MPSRAKRPSSEFRRRIPIRIPRRRELAAPPGHGRAEIPAPESQPRLRVLAYGPDEVLERTIETVDEIRPLYRRPGVCWLDAENLGFGPMLGRLGDLFDWHPLVREDVASPHQRPKAEDYEDSAYIVVHMPSGPDGLPLEQLSLVVGDGWLATIQGGPPGDSLEKVRDRIRAGRGRIRSLGSDYLAYAIVDAVIDHYFPVVERLNERLEALEQRLGDPGQPATVANLHAIRNDLHTLWRTVSAMREALGRLVRGEITFVQDATRLYLRDGQDHCAQLLDAIEACRELSTSLMELHQAEIANRTSEGMRLLTMIATIFIPMSFIAGLYGMNFDRDVSRWNMPELGWEYGYPLALALMASVGIGFLLYFRRNGWLSGGSSNRLSDSPDRDQSSKT